MIRKMINLLSLAGISGAAAALICVPKIQTDIRYCLIWCGAIVLSAAGQLWLWKEDEEDAVEEIGDTKDRKFYDFDLHRS